MGGLGSIGIMEGISLYLKGVIVLGLGLFIPGLDFKMNGDGVMVDSS
jgi:hypothetical protein